MLEVSFITKLGDDVAIVGGAEYIMTF